MQFVMFLYRRVGRHFTLLSWLGRILRNIEFNPRRPRQPGTWRAKEKVKER
jgi:hypothetical protein